MEVPGLVTVVLGDSEVAAEAAAIAGVEEADDDADDDEFGGGGVFEGVACWV